MDKAKLSRFDASGYLDSVETRAEYLRAAMETEDMPLILDSLGMIARAIGMSEVARDTGLGRESLYKALRRDSNPELLTVIKVMHALGIRLSAEPAPSAGPSSKELQPA